MCDFLSRGFKGWLAREQAQYCIIYWGALAYPIIRRDLKQVGLSGTIDHLVVANVRILAEYLIAMCVGLALNFEIRYGGREGKKRVPEKVGYAYKHYEIDIEEL